MKNLLLILIPLALCSCAGTKPINSPNIGTITQPISKAQNHVEKAKQSAQKLDAINPNVQTTLQELSLAGVQLESAQREAGKKQAQIDDLARKAVQVNEMNAKLQMEYKEFKNKVDGSIWTRNKIILGLLATNLLSVGWILRRPIIGACAAVLRLWIP